MESDGWLQTEFTSIQKSGFRCNQKKKKKRVAKIVMGEIPSMGHAVGKAKIFPIHRTNFCVRHADGAARIYFFLSLSLPECVTLWSRIIPVHVRVREERRKKEEKEKSP